MFVGEKLSSRPPVAHVLLAFFIYWRECPSSHHEHPSTNVRVDLPGTLVCVVLKLCTLSTAIYTTLFLSTRAAFFFFRLRTNVSDACTTIHVFFCRCYRPPSSPGVGWTRCWPCSAAAGTVAVPLPTRSLLVFLHPLLGTKAATAPPASSPKDCDRAAAWCNAKVTGAPSSFDLCSCLMSAGWG